MLLAAKPAWLHRAHRWISDGTVSAGPGRGYRHTQQSCLWGTGARHFWLPQIVAQQQQVTPKLRHGLLKGEPKITSFHNMSISGGNLEQSVSETQAELKSKIGFV